MLTVQQGELPNVKVAEGQPKCFPTLLGKHVTEAHCAVLDDLHNATGTKSVSLKASRSRATVTLLCKPPRVPSVGWLACRSLSKFLDVQV